MLGLRHVSQLAHQSPELDLIHLKTPLVQEVTGACPLP